jgi:hypothetical protein
MGNLPHVRSEMRRVYRSARGCKLTKHAAYIAAAKQLIADRCAAMDQARDDAEICAKGSAYQCRFHKRYEPESYDYEGQPEGPTGMAYYVRVLPRLVRFLKFVDRVSGAANWSAEL